MKISRERRLRGGRPNVSEYGARRRRVIPADADTGWPLGALNAEYAARHPDENGNDEEQREEG